MTGEEFRKIRKSFGLGKAEWMYALGYTGNKNTMHLNCHRYESGVREIPLYLAQYVWLLTEWRSLHNDAGMTDDPHRLPIWPEWSEYYEDGEKAES